MNWQAVIPVTVESPDEWNARLAFERRFISFVRPEDECRVWSGGKAGNGYGYFYVGRVDGKKTFAGAHRVSWVLAFGPIPPGKHVCHRCDNPACVRPSHLFIGSRSDNMQDCVRKGRHRNGSRLTAEIAAAIRDEYAQGNVTLMDLGAKYGIVFQHVSNIVHGKRWGNTAK